MSILHSIKKAAGFPSLLNRIYKNLSIQQKFLEENMAPLINIVMQSNDGSLDLTDTRKINNYYGLAVPAILGEAFCVLQSRPMSAAERWASSSQGAMTGLFDDFFDKDHLTDDHIEQLILYNENHHKQKSNQQLFNNFFKKALENVPDKTCMRDALLDVYKAQVNSKRQLLTDISIEELSEITFEKGGSSLLFYRTAFSPAITGDEKKLVHNLGSLMQLGNDIFDIYKDREAGIKTLITETNQVKTIRNFLNNRLEVYYQDAYRLGYPKKNTALFLDILSIGIFSRCLVCLDYLEHHEKLTGNRFEVKKYSREQLVCDMDKKLNMLRSAIKHITAVPA